MQRDSITERANGRWKDILEGIGISPKFLENRHGPCPICGGRDRFRWDNKEGNGTFYCSGSCGAGGGLKLVMLAKGYQSYKDACTEVEKYIGEARRIDGGQPVMTSRQKLEAIQRRWKMSHPINDGDQSPTGMYLRSRGITLSIPKVLRDDDQRPGMVAMMQAPNGNGVMAHLTLLTEDGRKAPTKQQKLFMPGTIARGSAVRLADYDDVLGIAEGIESALSAMELFGVPCWAALNEGCLQTWEPPKDVKRVCIFGDNDLNFVGQAAAYALAKRLSLRRDKVLCEVAIPIVAEDDWNDVLQEKRKLTVDRRPALVG